MDAMRLGQLDSAMQLLVSSAGHFFGTVYRVTTPKYATRLDALSGEGSRYASGRFHIKGQFLIAYTGCTLTQAEWEFAKTARNAAISREDSLPITILSANVQFSKVLDLTNPRVRRQLKVTKAELVQSQWDSSTVETLTQAIGRLAHKHGFEAILAPSPRSQRQQPQYSPVEQAVWLICTNHPCRPSALALIRLPPRILPLNLPHMIRDIGR